MFTSLDVMDNPIDEESFAMIARAVLDNPRMQTLKVNVTESTDGLSLKVLTQIMSELTPDHDIKLLQIDANDTLDVESEEVVASANALLDVYESCLASPEFECFLTCCDYRIEKRNEDIFERSYSCKFQILWTRSFLISSNQRSNSLLCDICRKSKSA